MSSWKYKIFNLWRQAAPTGYQTSEKYLPYTGPNGSFDSFPLDWHNAIVKSPSASACVSTIQDFLEGSGLSDPDLEAKVVNSRGETFFQIHQKTCKDFGEFEGFYWRVMYDALGRVTEWYALPFENCRLGVPDDNGYISKIYYNPFFGTNDYAGKGKELTQVYDVFNPKPEVIRAQYQKHKEKYKGQVLFFGTTSALSRFYPVHEGYSCFKWMGIERGVSDYHEDNINNGFLQSFMLNMKGNPNDPSLNEDLKNHNGEGRPATVAQEFDLMMSQNFMGAKRIGNMVVTWSNNPGEEPTVIPMPANNNGDLFITLDNQSTKKITISFKVPAILANINEGVSLGGDGNQVRVAVKLMQQRVLKDQNSITEQYQSVLKIFQSPYTEPVTIAPYNPYPELEVIDDKIWNEMTSEERRAWIAEKTDIELNEAEVVQQPQTSIQNAIMIKFPDNVIATVKKAIAHSEKMQLNCISKASMQVSDDIINNRNMKLKQVQRIYSYLKKRPEYANLPYDNCQIVQYNSWGGKAMEVFLESELERIKAWLN